MKNRNTQTAFSLLCLLAGSLTTPSVYAGWGDNSGQSFNANQGFGNYPPADIDKQIQNKMDMVNRQKHQQTENSNTEANSGTTTTQSAPAAPQNYPAQTYQPAPGYGGYNYNTGRNPWDNSGASFSNPWNNNGSNFNMPWSNNSSGMNMPWNNNHSGFSMPWDNNNNGFNMPWNNNGSGMTWGNRRYGY